LKHLLLAVLIAVVVTGCQTTNEPDVADMAITNTVQDMAEVTIVRAIVDEWVAAGKPDNWFSNYYIGEPSKTGDDDGPNRERTTCDTYGMPSCTTLKNGMEKCKDMCGGVFYVVEYAPGESICVSSGGAYVYRCTGSNY